MTTRELTVHLRRPHPKQDAALHDGKKRSIWRAGRRGGKTTAACNKAVEYFLDSHRVLYAVPTGDQLTRFWFEVKRSLGELIEAKRVYVNETMHIIEFPGTEIRLRAKTAWNSDTLRGDYADLLIMDEYQLMSEEAWGEVGAPMLLDNNGDAVFIYTPPSVRSKSISKARDKLHATKFWKAHQNDPRWGMHHWTSHDNPHISEDALEEITHDMTALALRQEIMAEDIEEIPGALWNQELLEATRVQTHPDLVSIMVGVDPPGGATECGIVVAGMDANQHIYIIGDYSLYATPDKWAATVIDAYTTHQADRILAEKNYGGDMVQNTVRAAAEARRIRVAYSDVQATRGKAVRAEPIAAAFEQGRAHIVGELPALEQELVGWVPATPGPSPNRLDAMVWAATPYAIYTEPEGYYIEDERVEISRY